MLYNNSIHKNQKIVQKWGIYYNFVTSSKQLYHTFLLGYIYQLDREVLFLKKTIYLSTFIVFTVILVYLNNPKGTLFGKEAEGTQSRKCMAQCEECTKFEVQDTVQTKENGVKNTALPKEDEAGNTTFTGENEGEWNLILVNDKNPLPDTYTPRLKSLSNGLLFDERAVEQLNSMLAAAKREGLSPVVCSAYRSLEKQQNLFNNKVNKLMSKGLDAKEADIEARKTVSYPGRSEHNLGLAVDIVSLEYQILNEKQADTKEAKWLAKHCSEYGFILRYPKEKSDITGVAYEPWHFRYVGEVHAREIMKKGLCLEEYLYNNVKF